ncbi:MAG: M14 metallopeptidase family protein [Vicinamibacterales bacterium]
MVRRASLIAVGVVLLALAAATARSQVGTRVTSPRDQWGANIGDDYFLATYAQLEDYWQQLDRESDRLSLVDIGRTEEGRTQWMAVITAPENAARLDRYREIAGRLARAEGLSEDQARALAAEGRAVVWIDGGLHADEVVSSQQLIELVYQLVSRDDAETSRILRDTIVLAVHANPDGHELVSNWYMRERIPQQRTLTGFPRLYQKYVGHDNNRDFYMSTQAETINMNRVLYQQWFPQIVYNHHQTGPAGTVMFAPPFRGPFNYRFDPLIPVSIDLLGAAMHARFAAEQKPGVTMRTGSNYSTWWNGGLRTTAYFHNQIGLLTETIGSPTPTRVPYVAERQVPGVDLPFPIAPQPWRFRQSIDYSMTANWAVLDAASRYRETLLLNIYRMGRNSIERGSRDSWTPSPHREAAPGDLDARDPRGYILPPDQPDFLTATKFVNALIRTGVTVERATAAFVVNGRTYPEGSFVIRTAQAFRPHVLDMFEPQDHPDDVPSPGAPPTPPYDNAGWTLAFQMGVAFDRVLDAFDGPFERVTGLATPPAGGIDGVDQPVGYLLSHQQNDAFIALNRLLQAGGEVSWPADRSAGDIFIRARPSTRPLLQQAAADLGLRFTGVAAPPRGVMRQLRPVHVALWDEPSGTPESGWIRWLLERFEFPFEVVTPDSAVTRLPAADVLILASSARPARLAAELHAFVERGGTLLAIGQATSIATNLDLPVSNITDPLPRERYYVPGSILRVRVDPQQPLAYGLPPAVDVMFDNSPVFRIRAGAEAEVTPIAWFDTAAPLRSGWAWGQDVLEGGVAALEVRLGKGRVVLFGPEITFRAQSHGTFKLLFNGIYAGAAVPRRVTTE